MRQVIWFSEDADYVDVPLTGVARQIELFSIAQDLRILKRNLREKYRYSVRDFKKFINTKKTSIKKGDIKILDDMFVARMNMLINEAQPSIEKGKTLDISLGIYDRDIKKKAVVFSRIYRRLLRSKATQGVIPPNIQKEMATAYNSLINAMRKETFAPVMNLFDSEDIATVDINELELTIRRIIKEQNQ